MAASWCSLLAQLKQPIPNVCRYQNARRASKYTSSGGTRDGLAAPQCVIERMELKMKPLTFRSLGAGDVKIGSDTGNLQGDFRHQAVTVGAFCVFGG